MVPMPSRRVLKFTVGTGPRSGDASVPTPLHRYAVETQASLSGFQPRRAQRALTHPSVETQASLSGFQPRRAQRALTHPSTDTPLSGGLRPLAPPSPLVQEKTAVFFFTIFLLPFC